MNEHIESALAALGLKPVFGGATMSFMGWVFSSAGAAWCGALIAFVGLVMNAYFNWKRDRREQQAHDARMREMA